MCVCVCARLTEPDAYSVPLPDARLMVRCMPLYTAVFARFCASMYSCVCVCVCAHVYADPGLLVRLCCGNPLHAQLAWRFVCLQYMCVLLHAPLLAPVSSCVCVCVSVCVWVYVYSQARVPVVKFIYPPTRTSVDVTVNNMLPLANTRLISTYCAIDPRLRALVLLVKHWAKMRGVNDTYRYVRYDNTAVQKDYSNDSTTKPHKSRQ